MKPELLSHSSVVEGLVPPTEEIEFSLKDRVTPDEAWDTFDALRTTFFAKMTESERHQYEASLDGKNQKEGPLGRFARQFTNGKRVMEGVGADSYDRAQTLDEAKLPIEEKIAVYATLECMANDLLGRELFTPKQQAAIQEFKLALQRTEDAAIDQWVETTDVPDNSPLLSVKQKHMAGVAGASISAALFLAGCAGGGGEVNATKVATEFAASQTPIVETMTPEPTKTATPEPTKAPGKIADELGLKSEPLYQSRTFETKEINNETYLVDQYNNVPKAVLENGTWRKLDYENAADAEVMYGALVPTDGEYISPDMLYSRDGSEWSRMVRARFLGDWEVRPIEYEGRQIDVYYLLTGLRDGGGRLHVVRLALDSPDIRDHWTCLFCTIPGGGRGIAFWPLEDTLSHVRIGEAVEFDVFEVTELPVDRFEADPTYPFINDAQFILMETLHNQQPDQLQMGAAERDALAGNVWPDRTVSLALPLGPFVFRESREDCKR